MKYIKLFEEDSFKFVESDEYTLSYTNSVGFTDYELKKIVNIIYSYIDSMNVRTQKKNNVLNNKGSLTITYISKREDLGRFFIRKVDDDYFIIKHEYHKELFSYDVDYIKCDQISGIRNFIKSLK